MRQTASREQVEIQRVCLPAVRLFPLNFQEVPLGARHRRVLADEVPQGAPAQRRQLRRRERRGVPGALRRGPGVGEEEPGNIFKKKKVYTIMAEPKIFVFFVCV